MRDHCIYVVTFTERPPYGTWHAQDDVEITGYGEPHEYKHYYLAPSAEIATAHFNYYRQYTSKKADRKFVKIERLDKCTVILELR